VSRARPLCLLFLLAVPLAACGNDPAPVPSAEPHPSAVAEAKPTAAPSSTATQAPAAEATAAPTIAAAPTAAATVAPTAAATASPTATAAGDPKAAPSAAPEKVAAAKGSPAAAPIALPANKKGVLAAGAADKVLKVGAPPLVRLLDAGSEPRSELAYAPASGPAPRLAMKMDMALRMTSSGRAAPEATVPPITMLLDVNVGAKTGSEWKIDGNLAGVSVDGTGPQQEGIAAAMRPQLELLKGLRMEYWLGPRGSVRDMKLTLPAGLPPQVQQLLSGMNQSFESMVSPLPAEPVGVGAKWQVVSRISSAGADILQSSTYTLKSRDGTKAALDVALTQLVAGESIKAPGMPEGMSAHVKSFNSGGTGVSKIDTTSVSVESGSVSLKTAMDVAVEGAGVPPGQESNVETRTTVQISRPGANP
jgi:Family of unknown function (DUF6263)